LVLNGAVISGLKLNSVFRNGFPINTAFGNNVKFSNSIQFTTMNIDPTGPGFGKMFFHLIHQIEQGKLLDSAEYDLKAYLEVQFNP
jgi:hypothetical protein